MRGISRRGEGGEDIRIALLERGDVVVVFESLILSSRSGEIGRIAGVAWCVSVAATCMTCMVLAA